MEEEAWRILVLERVSPPPLLRALQHFDSSIDIVREVGEVSKTCIEELCSTLRIAAERMGGYRVELRFEDLAAVDVDRLSGECRRVIELLMRVAKPGSVILFEALGG